MSSVEDLQEPLLRSLRQQLEPPPSAQARVRAGLALRIAAGAGALPVSPSDGSTSLASQGLTGVGRQLVAASLIGAVGFGAGYLTASSSASVAPANATAGLQMSAAPLLAPPAAPASVVMTVPSALTSAPVAAVRPAAPASAPPADTLSEEARELRRADRALRSGMPLLTLGILRDLDQKIPHGALIEERTAARHVARCQSGEAAAGAAAAAWLKQHPRSVYAARIQAACASSASPSDNGEPQKSTP